jgi:3,4-dihydroxy 2-butanone 4-phosphate synthase/GTP cyclohydrolase II
MRNHAIVEGKMDPIEHALAELAAGRPVVVVDDEDRENEGDLIFAAEYATAELVALAVTECHGLLCAPLTGEDCDRLHLPDAYPHNEDPHQTAFTVSVDARSGISTGISATDRAHTLRLLADPTTAPGQLTRPGHLFPLRAQPGGVLHRPGHTEAAVDLTRLAGLRPSAAICEITRDDGTMARLPELQVFAKQHRIALISIADLIRYRRRTERLVRPAARTRLPTRHGVFQLVGYREKIGHAVHLALVHGNVSDGRDVLVRVHSECLTGEVLGSQRCDCGYQLDAALAAIAAEGRGAVVYLRGQEGRGIGLLPKLSAYALQDQGLDTVDANLALGLPADARQWWPAAQILMDLGIQTVRLLTNNPAKRVGLQDHGITVVQELPLVADATGDSIGYLQTKRDRLGHRLPDLPRQRGPRPTGDVA